MFAFTKDSFDMVAQQYGLINVSSNYLLLNCNIWFEFDAPYAIAHGFIPLKLAMEMYEACKNTNPKQSIISYSPGDRLTNPEQFARHPSIKENEIDFKAAQTSKKIGDLYKEVRQKALMEDYDSCYIDLTYIYHPEAFAWFIETVMDFYVKKAEEKTL